MNLTSTQVGALAENVVANELMARSDGRLSPFNPIADDDGIDVLIYDKITGKAAPLQIKARTGAIRKRGTNDRGNIVHFGLRKATLNLDRISFLLCVLLDENLRTVERAWLLPISVIPGGAADRGEKFVIRASKYLSTQDKYKPYQCQDSAEVVQRLIEYFESNDGT